MIVSVVMEPSSETAPLDKSRSLREGGNTHTRERTHRIAADVIYVEAQIG